MSYTPKNQNGQATMANSEPVVIASDQSAVPVSGTVTANLSATDNTVLDNIDTSTAAIRTAVEILDNAIAGTEMQVDVVTSALPTGASTSANQTTIIGHVDGIEGLLTTIDADTGNLVTIETNTDFGTVTGGGTETSALRVTIANNSTGVVSVDDNGSTISIDDGGGIITVDGTVAATQSGTWTVQPGNTANTTAWLVNDAPVTSGGLSKSHLVSAATTNATNVKASAGQVYAITAFNLNASPRYLKFHNTSGTPTAGTGVTDTFLIPGNTAGAGLVINFDKGIAFSTGIAFTLVTGIADSNATAVAADEIVLNIYYK